MEFKTQTRFVGPLDEIQSTNKICKFNEQWVFVFARMGFHFPMWVGVSSLSFLFTSHHASTPATANLRRTMVFVGLGSNGFWFFDGEVMFLKVGFLFFGVGWCFP